MTYKIIRFYRNAGIRRRIIQTGLALEQAQKHCQNPETSSDTCTTKTGKARTRKIGPWFDAYFVETKSFC